MFQIKSKIFAVSVLGVSILLIGSLVSFTIYLVAKSNTAHANISVGYIFGGSYDESYKMSQQLLKDKVIQHAFVLPTFLHNQNEPPGKNISVSTASHLLLVQTSAELIPHVKDVIKKASNNSYPQKVWTAIFSAAAEAIPFLSFAFPTAPQSQATTKDLLITDSVRLSPDNADRQNGNIFRKLAAIAGRTLNLQELFDWTGLDFQVTTSVANPESRFQGVHLGIPFLIKVKGERKAGYIWTLGPLTSAALEMEFADKYEDRSVLVLDDALLYIKATAKQAGSQSIQLSYADPAGSGPPMTKIITVEVVPTFLVQL